MVGRSHSMLAHEESTMGPRGNDIEARRPLSWRALGPMSHAMSIEAVEHWIAAIRRGRAAVFGSEVVEMPGVT